MLLNKKLVVLVIFFGNLYANIISTYKVDIADYCSIEMPLNYTLDAFFSDELYRFHSNNPSEKDLPSFINIYKNFTYKDLLHKINTQNTYYQRMILNENLKNGVRIVTVKINFSETNTSIKKYYIFIDDISISVTDNKELANSFFRECIKSKK